MSITEKLVRAIRARKSSARTAGCYGRIVRSKQCSPETLSEDPGRQVVLVTGPSGLASFLGSGSAYDMLVQIGYTQEYIKATSQSGNGFWLVVFQKPPDDFRLATWKNCVELAAEEYPRVGSSIKGALECMRSTSFEDFESQAGFSFAEVHARGIDDPLYMTEERLLASDKSPLEVRRFMYHTIRLTELYTGNGTTLRYDSQTGIREYIMRNLSVCDLSNAATAQLDVVLPDAS